MKTLHFVICVCFISHALHAQLSDFSQTSFSRADSIAALYSGYSLQDLRGLSQKLTRSLPSEEEKFRAIYKWICNNIEYDYALFRKNQYKRRKLKDPEALKEWNKEISAQVFKNLLNKQRTVCTGYAYLVREMANHAGLSCVIIDGYGRTSQSNIRGTGNANHSWNAVKLNDKWYLSDATFSAGAFDTQLSSYVKKYDDSYFLAHPSLFIRNHYPLDPAWTLLNDHPTLNEFLNRPFVYSSIYRYGIVKLYPETFDITAAKGEPFSFRFAQSTGPAVEKVTLSVHKGTDTTTYYPNLFKDVSGLNCIDHTFSSAGTYTVHVLLNESYAFTYSVKVK